MIAFDSKMEQMSELLLDVRNTKISPRLFGSEMLQARMLLLYLLSRVDRAGRRIKGVDTSIYANCLQQSLLQCAG